MLMEASALPLAPFRRGKVRDVYVVDDARLLLVATDRVSAKEFSFKLATRSVRKPGRVTFTLRNAGHVGHNFHILGKGTPTIQPGKTAKLAVRFRKSGRFRYLCTVPGHAAAGMRGVFTVR